MTPFRLRLLALVFFGFATAISVNALYLQDTSRTGNASASAEIIEPENIEIAQLDEKKVPPFKPSPSAANTPAPAAQPRTSKVVTDTGSDKAAASGKDGASPAAAEIETADSPSEIDAALETVAAITEAGGASDTVPEPASPRIIRAIQRELKLRGYDPGGESGVANVSTRTAIVSYEFDSRLPLTGVPTEALLESLIFDASALAGQNGRAERFEAAARLVSQVQGVLARLGYGGRANGRLDAATREAIRKFAADRNLKDDGRLTARLLVELLVVTGKPLRLRG